MRKDAGLHIQNNEEAQVLAQTVVELYEAVGAENYVEILIHDTRPGGKKYTVNIQREDGETAGQRLDLAQELIGDLARLLSDLQADIDECEQMHGKSRPGELALAAAQEGGEFRLTKGDRIRMALATLAEFGLWGGK